MSDEFTDPDPARPYRRRTTPEGWLTRLIAMATLVTMITGGVSYALDLMPFAKTTEVAQLRTEVEDIKRGLAGMSADQKESKELQLLDRVQNLDDQLAAMKSTDPAMPLVRQQRNEADQRLKKVQRELAGVPQ